MLPECLFPSLPQLHPIYLTCLIIGTSNFLFPFLQNVGAMHKHRCLGEIKKGQELNCWHPPSAPSHPPALTHSQLFLLTQSAVVLRLTEFSTYRQCDYVIDIRQGEPEVNMDPVMHSLKVLVPKTCPGGRWFCVYVTKGAAKFLNFNETSASTGRTLLIAVPK